MSIPPHAVSVDIDVPFSHCDPLMVVWHGRYFEYLEAARTALMQSWDLDVPVIRNMGYHMFVTDTRIKYGNALTYADKIRVTAWLTETTPLLRFAYVIDNLTSGRRAARANMSLATTDYQNQLLSETPHDVLEKISLS